MPGDHLRLRLEPAERRTGAGALPPDRADEARPRVQARDARHVRDGDVRAREPQARPRAGRHRQGRLPRPEGDDRGEGRRRRRRRRQAERQASVGEEGEGDRRLAPPRRPEALHRGARRADRQLQHRVDRADPQGAHDLPPRRGRRALGPALLHVCQGRLRRRRGRGGGAEPRRRQVLGEGARRGREGRRRRGGRPRQERGARHRGRRDHPPRQAGGDREATGGGGGHGGGWRVDAPPTLRALLGARLPGLRRAARRPQRQRALRRALRQAPRRGGGGGQLHRPFGAQGGGGGPEGER